MYLIQQNVFDQMYVILSLGHWIKVDSNKKNSFVWRTGNFLLNIVSDVGENVYLWHSFKVKKHDSSEKKELSPCSWISNCFH